MARQKGSKKPSNNAEKRKIKALYYLFNQGIPDSKDELSYEKSKQKFISLFPEFKEVTIEKFNPEAMSLERKNIRDILRTLPREKKIWEEELVMLIQESFDLSYQALNRNMKDILGDEFPTFETGVDQEAYKKLKNKFAKITLNMQALPLAEREKYARAEMEVDFAWDIVLLTHAFIDLSKNKSTNINELFCLMTQLGTAKGLLMTLSRERVEFLKDIYSRIKGSENRAKGWALDAELYETALKEADEYWKNGGSDFHHEVARRLSEKYFGKLDNRTQSMKKKLIPIAKKYNKVFGMKGVKR